MVHPSRIKRLNNLPPQKGDYVLYWMQQSQRIHYNHALEFAALKANLLKLPLVVCFGLTDKFPEANSRHYIFMIEGLQELVSDFEKLGIKFVIRIGSPDIICIELAKKTATVICDMGYLRIQRIWRQTVANSVNCECIMVESDAIVPVEAASHKQEFSAATLRPKINKALNDYLAPQEQVKLNIPAKHLKFKSLELHDINKIISPLGIDTSVPRSKRLSGGYSKARSLLNTFIENKLSRYALEHSDPAKSCTSYLSPYLHFGQISPLEVAIKIMQTPPTESRNKFLDQLIVRRELGINFVYYNPKYDSIESLPSWAYKSLSEHAFDKRPVIYNLEQLEQGLTHDPIWNAAQIELASTGYMHSYMRMYWAKKLIEWTPDPGIAFSTAVYLNNKYLLDGRDPNSFAGIAWCFGLHDRPWPERNIFGKVRFMSETGLKRKFCMDKYIESVNAFKNNSQ
jgi:deoxyribodipyrimidine photo-lyase